MANLQPISQKQARITISALPGVFWTSIDGGDMSHEAVKYNDGTNGQEKTFTGMLSISDITLMKPYDPTNDRIIQDFISGQRSRPTPFSVAVTPVAADLQGSLLQGGQGVTYPNCVFISYKPAKFDRDGSGIAKVEMTIAVNSLPTY